MKTHSISDKKAEYTQDSVKNRNSQVHDFELNNKLKAIRAKNLYNFGVPVKIICRELDIAKSTLYHYLAQ